MKASRSSRTAAQMALSRALETRKAPAERVCCDPFAERFLDLRYRALLLGRPLREGVERLIERLFPGHHAYVLVRTRYLDDFVDRELAAGAAQLVILGAGFDSRAQRFADRLREVDVFEVDHPATSRQKRDKLARLPGRADGSVRHVAVDFDTDSLAERLEAHGYRHDRRSIFLWEGTTPYVSAAGVDATLRFVATRSLAGSALIFDYVLQSVIDGTCTLRAALAERDKMQRTSEPFVFGIDARQIDTFLATRGFENVVDVGSEELGARYLRPAGSPLHAKAWWRIVHASVARPATLP